jgi:hypothetical protein
MVQSGSNLVESSYCAAQMSDLLQQIPNLDISLINPIAANWIAWLLDDALTKKGGAKIQAGVGR